MNRLLFPLSLACLLLVLFAGAARAADTPNIEQRLIAESNGDAYWLCIVETRSGSAAPGTTPVSTTQVRSRTDPITGAWLQIASLQAKVIDAAPVGDRLAILLDGGEWRLLDQGGGAVGTSLPSPYQPLAFASEGKSLLAIATVTAPATTQTTQTAHATTQPATPAIFRWSGAGWSKVVDLPPDADPTHASLVSVDGTIHLALAIGDDVHIRKLDSETWTPVTTTPRKGVFKLLGNTPRVTIAQQDDAGAWTVTTPPATQPVRTFDAHKISDVVVIGPTLRLVFDDNGQYRQIAFDQEGAGVQFGPSTVAELPAPPTAHFWMQAVVVTLLILAMVATLRQKPPVPSEVLEKSMINLAPLGRRIAAGVVDALPLVLVILYVGGKSEQPVRNFEELPSRFVLPVFLGMAVWVLHVGISEAIWSRSLGKYLFGLRVCGYDGLPAGGSRLALRNLMRLIDVGMLFLPLLLVALTPMKQRVGDLAARTLVVQDKQIEPVERPRE